MNRYNAAAHCQIVLKFGSLVHYAQTTNASEPTNISQGNYTWLGNY